MDRVRRRGPIPRGDRVPASVPMPAVPLMSCEINLSSSIVADYTYVGFSAANGAAARSHYVLAGASASVAAAPRTISSLSSRASAAVRFILKQKDASARFWSRDTLLILSVVVLALAAVGVLYAHGSAGGSSPWRNKDWDGPHRISYKELHAATKGFRSARPASAACTAACSRGPACVRVKVVPHGSRGRGCGSSRQRLRA